MVSRFHTSSLSEKYQILIQLNCKIGSLETPLYVAIKSVTHIQHINTAFRKELKKQLLSYSIDLNDVEVQFKHADLFYRTYGNNTNSYVSLDETNLILIDDNQPIRISIANFVFRNTYKSAEANIFYPVSKFIKIK